MQHPEIKNRICTYDVSVGSCTTTVAYAAQALGWQAPFCCVFVGRIIAFSCSTPHLASLNSFRRSRPARRDHFMKQHFLGVCPDTFKENLLWQKGLGTVLCCVTSSGIILQLFMRRQKVVACSLRKMQM